MTNDILSKSSSNNLRARLRSMTEIFEKFFTIFPWNSADIFGDGTLVVITLNFGASSNTPAGNTTRKLV